MRLVPVPYVYPSDCKITTRLPLPVFRSQLAIWKFMMSFLFHIVCVVAVAFCSTNFACAFRFELEIFFIEMKHSEIVEIAESSFHFVAPNGYWCISHKYRYLYVE